VARGPEDNDSVREEFLSEAQEIVETLSRDLLLLDQVVKEGRGDPDLLNDVFRAVHTLKGLAGMFGMDRLQDLAHTLENLLDDLRLGRIDVTAETLDVLFQGVENIQRILSTAESGEDDVDFSEFAGSVDRVIGTGTEPTGDLDAYEFGEHVLSVLTEYEEHRLRTNIAQNIPLFRLNVARVRYPSGCLTLEA
jgi:two-component system chemotaxis sensor kinase CheA